MALGLKGVVFLTILCYTNMSSINKVLGNSSRVFLIIGGIFVAQSVRLCSLRRKLTVYATNTELTLYYQYAG